MKCKYRLPFYLVAVFISQISISSAQKITIECNVFDHNGIALNEAEVFVEEYNATGIVGGMLPDKGRLISSRKVTAGDRSTSGTLIVKADINRPCYLFFIAPGKKTVRTFFPPIDYQQIKLKITLFDTSKVRNEQDQIIYSDDNNVNDWLRVAAKTNTTAQTEVSKYMNALGNHLAVNGHVKDFKFSLENYYNDLLNEFQKTNDAGLKNFILLNLSFLCINNKYPVDQSLLKQLIDKLPASNYLWYTAEGIRAQTGIYNGLGKFKLNKQVLLPFFEALVSDCPSSERKPWQLLFLANNANDENIPEKASYLGELLSKYPESQAAKQATSRFLAISKVNIGAPLPDFSIRAVSNNDIIISNKTIMNKLTLIDFWATWCLPCIAQFDGLENVYKVYKEKGFEIVSISLDEELTTVKTFNNKRYKMPWLNGFAGENARYLNQTFGLSAIPRLILVDRNGIIITDKLDHLKGDELKKTIEKYIKE